MYQFNFTKTIMRYAQQYTITKLTNTVFIKGREVPGFTDVSAIISLQPSSNKILKMLESGDWSSADYIGFQYSSDNLPDLKDTITGSIYGDLKCVEAAEWGLYGVFVSGWQRLDAYQTEEA